MRRALITAVLLVPTLALAQVRITETGDEPDGIVNIAECRGDTGADSTIAVSWTISNTTFSQVEVRVSDTSGCPVSTSNSTAKTSSYGTFDANTTVLTTSAIDVMGRIGIVSDDCDSGANVTVNVCVIPLNTAGVEIAGATMTGTFLVDRTIPATPNVPSVTPGDRALRVSWTAVAGSRIRYRAEATPSDAPDTAPIRSNEVNDNEVRLENLEIGRQYDVVVIAISQGGNESNESPVATGTPVEVDDFWRKYVNSGGQEEGGCSTAGAGTLALLAFAPLALRRRRS